MFRSDHALPDTSIETTNGCPWSAVAFHDEVITLSERRWQIRCEFDSIEGTFWTIISGLGLALHPAMLCNRPYSSETALHRVSLHGPQARFVDLFLYIVQCSTQDSASHICTQRKPRNARVHNLVLCLPRDCGTAPTLKQRRRETVFHCVRR